MEEKRNKAKTEIRMLTSVLFVAIPPHSTVCKWRTGDFYAEIRTGKNKVCCAGDERT